MTLNPSKRSCVYCDVVPRDHPTLCHLHRNLPTGRSEASTTEPVSVSDRDSFLSDELEPAEYQAGEIEIAPATSSGSAPLILRTQKGELGEIWIGDNQVAAIPEVVGYQMKQLQNKPVGSSDFVVFPGGMMILQSERDESQRSLTRVHLEMVAKATSAPSSSGTGSSQKEPQKLVYAQVEVDDEGVQRLLSELTSDLGV